MNRSQVEKSETFMKHLGKWFILLWFISLSLISVFSFLLVLFFFTEPEIEVFTTSVSPSGKWELTVETALPSAAFAPQEMFVYVKKKGNYFRKFLINFEIANDGASLTQDNCNVIWKNKKSIEIAILRCIGEEQNYMEYTIKLEN
ncbi:hypothetical protein [Candidatus Uabimicrobium sp. HlEnr_7]|uniref:hypothetical protein n=1 Tax=Candidatus Uabimicrobium helgolandensis TaxID=3095367 RepID=UPI003557FACC